MHYSTARALLEGNSRCGVTFPPTPPRAGLLAEELHTHSTHSGTAQLGPLCTQLRSHSTNTARKGLTHSGAAPASPCRGVELPHGEERCMKGTGRAAVTLPKCSLEAAPPLRSLGTEVGGSPAVIFGVQLTQTQRDHPTDLTQNHRACLLRGAAGTDAPRGSAAQNLCGLKSHLRKRPR